MKVFRYFGPLLLLCLSQLLFDSSCNAETHLEHNHVKRSRKEPVLSRHGEKNVLRKDLKRKNVTQETTKDSGSTSKKQDGPSSVNSQNEQPSNGTKIHIKHDFHLVAKTGRNLTQKRANDVRSETIGKKTVHSKKSNQTNIKDQAKSSDLHSKKKTVVKKYSLFQSMNPFQSESEYPPSVGGEQDSEVDDDQTGEVKDQEFSPEEQQQQPIMSESNSPLQYGASQDSTGYQPENSQSSVASFATSNGEDTGQSEGRQPSSLEQAIQMQQAGYTQQSQEQGQDAESIRPDNQGGDLAGQGSQMIDAGQLQYQGEQAGQGQEQEQDQGAQEQGDQEQNAQEQGDQEQNAQEQTVGTTGFEQTGFQQEQPQETDQQQSQGIDQQQQDQTQEYQQQEEQQQQLSEEAQGSEGVPSESQSLATSSSSYGGLFGAEGQQTAAEQQGQATASFTNEQSSEGADKTGPPPGVQYASSIEEALKEPSVSPQESQESQESNGEGGDGQGSLGANDGASVINIGPGTDFKEGNNNGFLGAGTVSAPTGYQASTVDDNGNPIQTGTESNINAYAPMNDHASNGQANGFEENQQLPSSSSSESPNAFNFAQQKLGSGTKVSPLADDIYKIINIANKNGPTAVKGCNGCPPHARCIDKVCIINDDQPLAHILSALSGPEPDHVSVSDEQSPPNECKDECHYNAKCINSECICKSGYTGDGLDCRPDTCLPGCKQHGKCIKGFCLCDHHHYFNGYECAPYKITHRNCPIQCATRCHARCPPNCCRHPVLKMHYDSGNHQQMNASPNAPSSKPKNGPRPTVLKPIVEVGEPITNFAPDFQKRPGDSDASNLEAVTLKDPAGGFAISQLETKPLLGDEGCPDQCKTECKDTCPVRCCLGKCPVICMEHCHPSCPKTCCYIHGTKNPFPMIDPKVQENFMKTMAEKFCPNACKSKCDSKCPPICCEGNSSSVALTDANFQHLKSESKNSADFFGNAMSWFGMMNFLNMMYSMYGNLYNPKHKKYPLKFDDHKVKTIHHTKPKIIGAENHVRFKEVGVAEKANDLTVQCPGYCNKTCLHECPSKCCHDKQSNTILEKVGTPLKCSPSCSWFCSNSCPPHCCSNNKRPLVLEHHPTEPVKIAKFSPIAPPQLSPAKPPAACTPDCPAYCYPHCLENCCRRGEVPPIKPTTAQEKAKQSYSNFFSKTPAPSNQNCPSICQNKCAPSCPARCCAGSLSSPPSPNLTASSQAQTNAPLCPGNCVSDCFPACTISCCRADLNKHGSDVNIQTKNPTRRHNQPASETISFPLPPPIALCHPGCSRSCYPNCDEVCCKASSQHVPGFKEPTQVDSSSSYTIKVPCPIECRPFNCLYYCHHDCCLREKKATDLKIRQASRVQDKLKYLNGMRKKKTMASRLTLMHVASDKRLGDRIHTKG